MPRQSFDRIALQRGQRVGHRFHNGLQVSRHSGTTEVRTRHPNADIVYRLTKVMGAGWNADKAEVSSAHPGRQLSATKMWLIPSGLVRV